MDCLTMVRNTLNDFSRPKVNFQTDYPLVEVVDGARKMRHLFLFDNAIVCTKPGLTGAEVVFTIKWVLRLAQVRIFKFNFLHEYELK